MMISVDFGGASPCARAIKVLQFFLESYPEKKGKIGLNSAELVFCTLLADSIIKDAAVKSGLSEKDLVNSLYGKYLTKATFTDSKNRTVIADRKLNDLFHNEIFMKAIYDQNFLSDFLRQTGNSIKELNIISGMLLVYIWRNEEFSNDEREELIFIFQSGDQNGFHNFIKRIEQKQLTAATNHSL